MNYAVCVPTLNGGLVWQKAAQALKEAISSSVRVLVVDSGSTDGSDQVSIKMGFELIRIEQADFDHGATRQLLVECILEAEAGYSQDVDFIIFITQDSILKRNAIVALLRSFNDPDVMMAYGRQLPREGAGIIESHARYYNYPDRSIIKDQTTIRSLGFKTVFSSNSFAAYRVSALCKLGGFAGNTVCSEDVLFSAKIVFWGGRVAYVAEAQTIHSHYFGMVQEFRRSFDIGAFHSMEPWILVNYGAVFGEGFRFFFSQARFVLSRSPRLIVESTIRCVIRYLGYTLGRRFKYILPSLRPILGCNTGYWQKHLEFCRDKVSL